MSEEEKVIVNPEETPNTNENKKVKKPKSKARKIVEWVLLGIFGVFFAFVLAGNIDGMVHKKDNCGQTIRFGYGSFIIKTNSMEPEIKKGAAIVTYKEDLKKFDERLKKGDKIDVVFSNSYYLSGFEPDTEVFKAGTQIDPTNLVMTHRLREVHIDESVEYGKGRYIFVASGINDGGDYSKKGQYQVFTEKEYLGVVKVSNQFLGGVFSFMTSAWGLILLLLVPAGYLIVTYTMDIFKTLKEAETAEEAERNDPENSKLSKLSDEERARLKKELLDEMVKAKKAEKEKSVNEKE